MRILIICPAHNEGPNLPGLIHDIRNCGVPCDVVVIDDASTDNTCDVARELRVPVLRLAANLGIGGAVQTGFKYAVQNGYDVAVQMDGDGQHDPAWLAAVLEPIYRNEADCVIGSRFTREDPDTEYRPSFPRRMGMLFSTGILLAATRLHITDTTSGFRALNRPVFSFFAHDYPVDHPEAETLLMLHQRGFRMKEVPIRMRVRTRGRSLFTFAKSGIYPIRVIVGFLGLLLNRKD